VIQTYVIHVASEIQRRKLIEKELDAKEFEVSFILDGDISTLNTSRLNTFFSGKMKSAKATTSCAFKHILAYQDILKNKHPFALILEDDIRFYANIHLLDSILKEIKDRDLHDFIVSLEDSRLKYIPRSKRQKGRLLYVENSGRMTGAYLIDFAGAKRILDYTKTNKMSAPIDWFHNECIAEKVINMYWAQPPIAVQGSLEGSVKSLIGKVRFGGLKVLAFRIQRLYKRVVYSLR
jgi:glycosyl transferase family 25